MLNEFHFFFLLYFSISRSGIEEEARCAAFSISPPGVIESPPDSDNESFVQDWIPKPPLVLPYKPVFIGPVKYDPTTSNSKKMNKSLT